jgi:murein DD-endopeptidase MepM/ murein hydrolase activator NlpD
MSVTVIAIGVTTLAATTLTIAGTISHVPAIVLSSPTSSVGAAVTTAPTTAAAPDPASSAGSLRSAPSASVVPLVLPWPPAIRHPSPSVPPTAEKSLDLQPVPHLLAITRPAGARWVWPVEVSPQVIRGFQPPPKNWLPGHRGADLAVVPGDHVRAAGAGTVTFAGPLAGRGVIVVSHGALRTTYEPVTASVQVGDVVTVGQRIGVIAVGASHCGGYPACLHWGLRRDEVYLEPLSLLGMVHPVLLPLP